jgi:hypothetical protein
MTVPQLMTGRLLVTAALLGTAACLFLTLALITACTQQRLVLIPERQRVRTPPEIQQACSLAELKCSRCHDLERIKLAHHELVNWPVYVEKMRRQPGSGISSDDGTIILKCLDYLKKLQSEYREVE